MRQEAPPAQPQPSLSPASAQPLPSLQNKNTSTGNETRAKRVVCHRFHFSGGRVELI
ncbi:unnamed protein product, partial [Arctogadus glacialis]